MLEFKVTLRLSSSECSLEDFKRVMGEPTRGFSVGDEYSGGRRKREFSLWAFESTKLPGEDFEAHLQEILCLLEGKYLEIRHSFTDYEIDLFCMFSTNNGQGGAVLSADTMSKISSFGINMIFDVYAEN